MATAYGRAGGGNFSGATTWSTTTGGGADYPTLAAGDAVILDANSTGTFTYDTNISLLSVDCTGFAGTLAHTFNGTMPITGNTFKFVAGMTYTTSGSSRTVTFSSAGTCLITTAGKNFQQHIYNGTGTYQLQDSLSATLTAGSGITLTAGTLDLNNQTASCSGFVASGSSTRAVLFGSGGIAMSGTGSVDFSGSAISVTKGTGSITISGNTASARNCNVGTAITGGLPAVIIGANTSAGAVTFSGTSTVASLAATAPCRLRFTGAATFTITAAPALSGSGSNRFQICSSVPGSPATISVGTGTVTFDNAFIEDITGAGGATFTATNSYNVAGNTNISPITEPTSGGARVIGG